MVSAMVTRSSSFCGSWRRGRAAPGSAPRADGRARIDAKIAELAPPERPMRQHALDRLLDDALGKFSLKNRPRGTLLDAADMASVVVVDLLLALPAREHDLGGIDDDDIVAAIDMRGEGRQMLATQPQRHDRREPADHEAGGVDHHPLLLDLGWLCGIGRHGTNFRRSSARARCQRGTWRLIHQLSATGQRVHLWNRIKT